MKKKVFLALAVILIGLLGWPSYRYFSYPDITTPYPYRVELTAPSEIEKLYPNRPIDVLIVGDRMARHLFAYKMILSETLSKDLKTPINIGRLSSDDDGAHRTLAKLRQLKALPKIIIYSGGSTEYSEQKYPTSEAPSILFNIQRYDDPTLQTGLLFWPSLSRFIYKRMSITPLSDTLSPAPTFSDDDIQYRSEIDFKLYEYELTDIARFVREQHSTLILTTLPLNLDLPPKHTCNAADTKDIQDKIAAIESLLAKGDKKMASTEVQALKGLAAGHAGLHFLIGKISKEMGEHESALQSMHYATALDCGRWRGSSVHNAIIRKVSGELDVPLFDFSRLLEDEWGQTVTFLDEIRPQAIYYEKGISILARQIKTILNI